MKKQKLEIGDQIIHHEPWYRQSSKGTVIQILDLQFLYKMKCGAIRHCMFNELWDYLKD